MSKAIEPVETFFNRIRQNETEFSSAFNNYNMCYIHFNINDGNSNFQCSNIIGKSNSNCNDCLRTSENTLLQSLSEIQNIQQDILTESKKLGGDEGGEFTPEMLDQQKDDLINVVDRYNTSTEMLSSSVEMYKIYRIQLITEVVKLLVIISIIFYLLQTTTGVKTMTYVGAILYMTLSALEVFYPSSILLVISIISFLFFVAFSIMNIHDISINYQNIKNKSTEVFSQVTNELNKEVKVL